MMDTWLRAIGVDDSQQLRRRRRDAERLRAAGRVMSIRAVAGRIEGRVQGSHARPHLVELGVDEWQPEQWRAVSAVLGQQARHYARLLAGQLPEQFTEVLETLSLSLVPQPEEWRMACTCAAPAPCVHQIALWLQIREQMEDDPYLLPRVRGRSREQLLAEIRDRMADETRDSMSLEQFGARARSGPEVAPWDVSLPAVRAVRSAVLPLQMLGDPPGWAGPASATALFAPLIVTAAQRAGALLDDDHESDRGSADVL